MAEKTQAYDFILLKSYWNTIEANLKTKEGEIKSWLRVKELLSIQLFPYYFNKNISRLNCVFISNCCPIRKWCMKVFFLMKGPTYISLESWFKIIIQNRAYSISLSVAYVYNVHKSQDKKYFYFQRWVLILIRWFNPSSQTISMKSNKSSWRHQ